MIAFRRWAWVATLLVVTAVPYVVVAGETKIQAGWNFDTGMDAHAASSTLLEGIGRAPPFTSWLRIRGIDVGPKNSSEATASTRHDLTHLRSAGYRIVALIRWPAESWKFGVREPVRENRLPCDLREAFARCRRLVTTYGDVVDYWEIDNEPDISFVEENPETYAAYLKACYLGIRRGAVERSNGRSVEQPDGGGNEVPTSADRPIDRSTEQIAESRVLMAPLALPPGPYFSDFVANGGLSYTDGFNYHYYGYPEDFTGVYRQFETAIEQAGSRAIEPAEPQPDRPFNRSTAQPPSVWRSRFFPSADGWRSETITRFDQTATDEQLNAALNRPRAGYEPPMHRQGRWLVTDGVKVEEKDGVWRFTITSWPRGPLRAPVAELVLPADWVDNHVAPAPNNEEPITSNGGRPHASAPLANALITFQYRHVDTGAPTVPAIDTIDPVRNNVAIQDGHAPVVYPPIAAASNARPKVQSNSANGRSGGSTDRPLDRRFDRPIDRRSDRPLDRQTARPIDRELPVFLTEYGFGALDKITRDTKEGRERQRAWFASVGEQIRALGIEGAMAFVLMPYLERDQNEYGLLMTQPISQKVSSLASLPPVNGPEKIGSNFASPALEQLLADGTKPLVPHRWRVTTPPPSAVVVDFIPGKGLGEMKTYGGYFLVGQAGRDYPAEGQLVVYNFTDHAITGEIRLSGNSWRLAAPPPNNQEPITSNVPPGPNNEQPITNNVLPLALAPFDRRLIPIQIATHLTRFVAAEVGANFTERALSAAELAEIEAQKRPETAVLRPSTPATPPSPVVSPPPNSSAAIRLDMFECYFRTENGNLYQTWPRLLPSTTWRTYMQRTENFTMAFHGRAHEPWRFFENKPTSLVFHFHPDEFPVTYEVRHERLARFFTPLTGDISQKNQP